MLSRHAGRTRGRVLGDAGRVLPLAGSVLQARERTCPSTPSQTSPHTRSSVGSGQARHGGRGEGACMPPRRSGRVLWRGHAGTRACRKANLSTSQKSFFFSPIACNGHMLTMGLRGLADMMPALGSVIFNGMARACCPCTRAHTLYTPCERAACVQVCRAVRPGPCLSMLCGRNGSSTHELRTEAGCTRGKPF